jgi:hypothetical protein
MSSDEAEFDLQANRQVSGTVIFVQTIFVLMSFCCNDICSNDFFSNNICCNDLCCNDLCSINRRFGLDICGTKKTTLGLRYLWFAPEEKPGRIAAEHIDGRHDRAKVAAEPEASI